MSKWYKNHNLIEKQVTLNPFFPNDQNHSRKIIEDPELYFINEIIWNKIQFLKRIFKKKKQKLSSLINFLNQEYLEKSKWEDLLKQGKAIQYSNTSSYNSYLKSFSYIDYESFNPALENFELKKVLLDPTLTLKENMLIFFKKSQKYKNSLKHIENRKLDSESKISHLEENLKFIENLTQHKTTLNWDDWFLIKKFEEDSIEQKPNLMLRKGSITLSKKEKKSRKGNFLSFVNQEGRKFLVGTNSKENHFLTFKVARDYDIFLHVENYPGSHIIILMNHKKELLSSSSLIEGANLALKYSKAVKFGEEFVIYTQRKYLKSIKNEMGKVLLKKRKRIYIKLDPKIIDHLKPQKVDI